MSLTRYREYLVQYGNKASDGANGTIPSFAVALPKLYK
ncbi:hypothetical protein Bache_0884 [Bacteroides helcogenes P 36-108]|uniref:Uncharacterized protein n=1 Tax=Bacteroides helcogenes (strain ATCC 35417 / DSM 20613 / JCM 6297 / CCUG 15421 / P 36-108) TaxID=693979 RepID=E6SPZ6_BACT6|nr:hypothetical protein Bache_0884 [Bacteroides helcogenes P 36-108]